MSREERDKWERRYASAAGPSDPDPVLAALAGGVMERLRGTAMTWRALDVAAGTGRHAVLLAALGLRVDAPDISEQGLRRLLARVPSGSVHPFVVDLDGFPLPRGRYDVAVCVDYMNRRILQKLPACVRPGGAVFVSLRTQDSPHGGRFALDPGELERMFASLEIAHSEEAAGRARILAYRPL